jgi:hypothetical protein
VNDRTAPRITVAAADSVDGPAGKTETTFR